MLVTYGEHTTHTIVCDTCGGEGGCPDCDPIRTRTPDEVKALCRNWRADPCWDLETTEGFETHAPELLEYRMEWEATRQRERDARLAAKAETMGIPGNVKLAAYIEGLERRIATLHDSIENGY